MHKVSWFGGTGGLSSRSEYFCSSASTATPSCAWGLPPTGRNFSTDSTAYGTNVCTAIYTVTNSSHTRLRPCDACSNYVYVDSSLVSRTSCLSPSHSLTGYNAPFFARSTLVSPTVTTVLLGCSESATKHCDGDGSYITTRYFPF